MNREFQDREKISSEIYEPNIGSGRNTGAERAPVGAPKTKAKVISTFDGRPINAYDFYATGEATTVTDYVGPG